VISDNEPPITTRGQRRQASDQGTGSARDQPL